MFHCMDRMARGERKATVCLTLALLFSLGASAVADAQQIEGLNTTQGVLRAKAAPDECFSFIGMNWPFAKPPCLFSQPKVNQAYVWAITDAGSDIWFGTAANPQCLAQSLFGLDPQVLVPYQTPSWVCEFGSGPYSPWLLPAIVGDFRPPQIFVWDRVRQSLVEMTPTAPVTPSNPLGVDPLLTSTRGIRAAATVGNLVMLAGPSLLGGLNFFFYRADTRTYLGSATLPGYNNIRQFTTLGGQLYAAVGQTLGPGAVLRWTGSISAAPCASCLAFEVVGTLDGIGVFITHHQGRLFASVWPSGLPQSMAALYMSPIVPVGGLTAAHASSWTKVWDANEYEPDPVIAASYAGGALASFDGYLYWGTMHVPWHATALFLQRYGTPATEQAWLDAVVNTFRTAVVFRGRNFGTAEREVDLLYGSHVLAAYQGPQADQPGKWEWRWNNMPTGKQMPLYGAPGFNNFYNNYVWSMSVWNNKLWIGTMDWSYSAEQGTRMIFEGSGQSVPLPIGLFFAWQVFGGDLFFFQDSKTPAVAESSTGVGNYTNYGVRSMLPTAQSLFLGMANPSNLLTGPVGPRGGWELIELSPGRTDPVNLLEEFSCAPLTADGTGMTTCTVRASKPAPTGGLVVGVIGAAPEVQLHIPLLVSIPEGEMRATFRVTIEGVPTSTHAAVLVAGLNGGSRVASFVLAPPGASSHAQ